MSDDLKPENPANIGLVHEKCAPKPDPDLAATPAEFFVGKFVKTSFKSVDPHGKTRLEHLWVFVTAVIDTETIHGLIENDPVLDGVPVYGEAVDVRLDNISKVLPGLE